MKNLLREFRVIPTLLIAVSCLAVLKIAGLVLEGGYVLNNSIPSSQAQTKLSWAQSAFNFPAPGKKIIDPADITGSVEGKPKEAKAEEPKSEFVRSPGDTVLYPEPGRPVSGSERAVLERLQSRRQEIEARAREIDIRENLIKGAEKRIEGRIEELKAGEARNMVSGQQKNETDAARFKSIVTMYEGMKPKDAAKVFDRLEMSVLFEITSQMAPRKMSDILGQMQPEAAERLTVELARRATADRGSSVNDLPKIEGRPQQRN